MSKTDKVFKEGMVAGAKPFGEKLDQLAEQQGSGIDKISEGLDGVTGVVSELIDDMESSAILAERAKFGLNTEMDISGLPDDRKEILVSLLLTLLSKHEQNNDEQKDYYFSVKQHLEVANPVDDFDFSLIEDIDSRAERKMMFQIVCEFLFLGSCDTSFLGSFSDVINAFDLKENVIEEIINNIDSVYSVLGIRGIQEHFTPVAEQEIFFDEDSCIEENEHHQIDPNFYEEIVLSDLINIKSDENATYQYKKIYTNAIINVDGSLKFDNCIVCFSKDEMSAIMTVKGKVDFCNCEIFGLNDNSMHDDETRNSFGRGIINGTDTSSLSFENCVFRDAGHFIATNGTFSIESCSIINPGVRFLSASPSAQSIIKNSSVEFNSPISIPDIDAKRIPRDIFFISSGNSNEVVETLIENCIFAATDEAEVSRDIIVFSAKAGVVRLKNSEFHNFTKVYATIDATIAEESLFSRCRMIRVEKAIKCAFENSINIGVHENLLISDCDFSKCGLLRLPEKSIMKNCRASDCDMPFVMATDSKIVDCVFSNMRKTKDSRAKINNGLGESENCVFLLQNTSLESCVFNGIELKDNAFLIVGEKHPDLKSPIVVEKCIFRNCYTDRSDKKIIIGREFYGVFTLKTRQVDIVNSCVGLESVECGTLSAPVPVENSKNNCGLTIGTAIGSLLLGGVGAAIGGVIGAAVDASKEYK